MASFGDEVFNVRTSERGLLAIASDGSDVRVGLQAFLDAASAYANRKGASVYLPPGQYGIVARTDRSTDFTSAVIPPGPDIYVPKTFFCGLRLWGDARPRARRCRRHRRGHSRGACADLHHLRCSRARHDARRLAEARAGGVHHDESAGIVPRVVGGDRPLGRQPSPAVYALNAQALEDCFRAAHTDRSFPGGINFPPIPVVLRGQYYLQHELVIQPMTGPLRHFSGAPTASGIVIRGQQGTGTSDVGVPTFEAGRLHQNSRISKRKHMFEVVDVASRLRAFGSDPANSLPTTAGVVSLQQRERLPTHRGKVGQRRWRREPCSDPRPSRHQAPSEVDSRRTSVRACLS